MQNLHQMLQQFQYDWCSWIPNSPPTMRNPPPTKKGEVDVAYIVNSLPDRGRSCWHLGAVWALSQFQDNEVRSEKTTTTTRFLSTFTTVIQFYWHLWVCVILVVLRHVSWWTLHWETGKESHGDFAGKAGWAFQSHQKSQWREETPLLLPVSRQNPKQCGCLSLHTCILAYHLHQTAYFSTDSSF